MDQHRLARVQASPVEQRLVRGNEHLGHATSGHTNFLLFSRRLAPGHQAPRKKRRPAPGAYGPDYVGPRPS